jgi:antitoxin YefM
VDATTGHALAVEDPEALREAAHLLRAPANARRLMESIAEAEGGSVERS